MEYSRANAWLMATLLIVASFLIGVKAFAAGDYAFNDQTLANAQRHYDLVKQDLNGCMEEYPGMPNRCSYFANKFQRVKSDLRTEQYYQQQRQLHPQKVAKQDTQDPVIAQINKTSWSPAEKARQIQMYKDQSSQKCMACP